MIQTDQNSTASITTDSSPSPSARWAGLRDDIRARHAARVARKALQRDLASYTTPAERNELTAILDRHPDHQTDEIRRIINHRLAA